MKRLVTLLFFLPLAVLLIVFSVVNRHPVVLQLDPSGSNDPVFSLTLPMFMFLFIALIIGIVIGGLVVWFAQGRYRKLVREKSGEAAKWRSEADMQRDRAEKASIAAIGAKTALVEKR